MIYCPICDDVLCSPELTNCRAYKIDPRSAASTLAEDKDRTLAGGGYAPETAVSIQAHSGLRLYAPQDYEVPVAAVASLRRIVRWLIKGWQLRMLSTAVNYHPRGEIC